MGQYSIKELEKLSGIKAHTIRIWEKRHKIISPNRTSTNIRLYSDADLKKIINVAIANNAGVKISHIARLTDDALAKLVSEQSDSGGEMASPIDQLIVAMVELDEIAFETIMQKFSDSMGFAELVVKVVYPFMEKIGILWQTGNITPAQEHFISNLVRQKIIVAIDNLPHPPAGSPKAILFLPENEWHEIGLLFYQYLARKSGVKTIYLGQSVPYSDLVGVVGTYNPRWIITSIVTTLNQGQSSDYLERLSTDFNAQTILISGRGIQEADMAKYKNIDRFWSAESFLGHLV
jgi:MerR family transcriptional regulator, light-induced transcriptional regulator